MFQCYYYETIMIGNRAYNGKKVLTEQFETENEAERYCTHHYGVQGPYDNEMLYEEVE